MSNVHFTTLLVGAAAGVTTVAVAGVAAGQSTATATARRARLSDGSLAGQTTVTATATTFRKRTGVSSVSSRASATATVVTIAPSAQPSRGDEFPMWVGVPAPPIPTLRMVGQSAPATPAARIRTPVHHRDIVRIALGTLWVRVARVSLLRRERVPTLIERGRQVVVERQHRHEQGRSSAGGLTEAIQAEIAHYVEVQAVEWTLEETSAATLISQRVRMVRAYRESAHITLTLEALRQDSLAMQCAERVVIPWATQSAVSVDQRAVARESFAVRTAYKLTYQRGLSTAEIAAAVMAVLDEAA